MKKKVLSTLLAVCLLVGAVIPTVFALDADEKSSRGGSDSEITSLKTKQSSYNVEEDGGILMLADEVLAFCGNTKLCADPDLTFSVSNDSFTHDGAGNFYTMDSRGSATVTITANNGKARTTVKLTINDGGNATGFTYDKSSYAVPVGGGAEDFIFKIEPTPSGSRFTYRQIEALREQHEGDLWGYANATISSGSNKDGSLTVRLDGDELRYLDEDNFDRQVIENTFTFPHPTSYTDRTYDKKLTIYPVDAREATSISNKQSSVTVRVGETIDITELFTVGPSSANTGKEITYSTTHSGNNNYDDYAEVSSDGEITGIAVGESRLVATLDNAYEEDSLLIKVIPADGSITGGGELSSESETLKIGSVVSIVLEDAGDSEVKWSVDSSGVVGLEVVNNNTVKVTGKTGGAATLTAKVNGNQVGVCSIIVTSDQATTPTPTPTPDPTPDPDLYYPNESNPQTGDSFFSNLF